MNLALSHAAEARTHSCGTVDARSAEGDVSNVQAHWYRRSGVLHADTVQRHTGAPVRVCPSEGYVRRAPTECEMRCVRTELFPCQSPVTRSVLSTLDANANREPGLLCVDAGGRIQRRNRVGCGYRHMLDGPDQRERGVYCRRRTRRAQTMQVVELSLYLIFRVRNPFNSYVSLDMRRPTLTSLHITFCL